MRDWTSRRFHPPLLVLALALAPAIAGAPPVLHAEAADGWRALEPGLDFGEFSAPGSSATGDSRIRILRIDPERYELRLLCASASVEGAPLTARDWCRKHDLVAAMNAAMYQTDHRTSVSLMRSRDHTNNPRLTRDKALLAFDRRDTSVPPVRIVDRECDDLAAIETHYGSLVQSIRMISCQGRNVWSPQPGMWSTAAIATDEAGRVLFIHSRSAFTTHDFIEALRALPLGVARAMYAEGGPEAQLYVNAGGEDLEFVGSYDSGLFASDEKPAALPVPNVIGVARR